MEMFDNGFTYLDYNATTPVDDRVLEAMIPYFKTAYANAGSSHLSGLSVREAVDEAGETLAGRLGTQAGNILYTSGATESVNLAIKGLLPSPKRHIVTVATEHKAVLETCAAVAGAGYRVTYLPVDSNGLVDLNRLADVVTDDTLLVSVMLVNNETGVIQPMEAVCSIAHQKGALVLSDATQAVGKLPVNVNQLGVDLMAFSAHKFYGPKGIGGLYVSDRVRRQLQPQIHGGGQQSGLRSGTLNVPAVIGMAKALEIADEAYGEESERIGRLRDQLEAGLLAIPDTFVNGNRAHRMYNTSNISFSGTVSEQLILQLGRICVSSGSACTSTVTRPSHVLQAMGLSDTDGLSALRFSVGRFTTTAEIERTINSVKAAVSRLRGTPHA